MKIMFICTGNICRSAMAHAMLQKMAEENKKNIEAYSCGIYAQNGDIPTDEAISVMKNYNVDLTKHRATNIKNSNIEEMDVILCATETHKNMVVNIYPNLVKKIFTIKEYAGYNREDLSIEDPWGYGLNVYKNCAKEINECLEKIIKNKSLC